jgi:hypothetical protein
VPSHPNPLEAGNRLAPLDRLGVKPPRTETLDYVHQMGVSDVLQVDFDANDNISHSMFVTRRDGTGAMADELYLTYHSTDTLNKKFSSIFAANPNAWYHAHRT